jgi:hypothetical protein
MMTKTFRLLLVLVLGGCGQTQQESLSFTVLPVIAAELPGNVLLRVTNHSKEYLCFSKADVRLGSPYVSVDPPSEEDNGDNRPPAHDVNGLDINDGLFVLPPNMTRDLFLSTEELSGRKPAAKRISGRLRAVACAALFTGRKSPITVQSYSVDVRV